MLTVSLLLAIFLGSLVSGWHCALMCGGIAAAIERPAVVSARINSRSELFFLQLIMHLGRLTTYMLLGALAALVGAASGNRTLSLSSGLYTPLLPLFWCGWGFVSYGGGEPLRPLQAGGLGQK